MRKNVAKRTARRGFIKKAGAAAIMSLVPATVRHAAWAAGSDAPEKKEVKIGFILRDFDTAQLAVEAEILREIGRQIERDYPEAKVKVETRKQYRNMQDELWVALPDKNGDGVSDGLYKFANMGNSQTATRCQNEWTGGVFLDPSTFFVKKPIG